MTPTWVSVTSLVISILALVANGCGPIRRGFWGSRAWIVRRRRKRLKSRLKTISHFESINDVNKDLAVLQQRLETFANRATGVPIVLSEATLRRPVPYGDPAKQVPSFAKPER